MGDRGWFQTLVSANGIGVNWTGGIVPDTGADVTGEPGLNGAVVGSCGVLACAGGGGSALDVAGAWVAGAGVDFFAGAECLAGRL